MSTTLFANGYHFENPSVADLAEYQLRKQGQLALRLVWCEDHGDGLIILRGCLPSYYLRQLAENIVAGVEGVQAVTNHIDVLGDGPLAAE